MEDVFICRFLIRNHILLCLDVKRILSKIDIIEAFSKFQMLAL